MATYNGPQRNTNGSQSGARPSVIGQTGSTGKLSQQKAQHLGASSGLFLPGRTAQRKVSQPGSDPRLAKLQAEIEEVEARVKNSEPLDVNASATTVNVFAPSSSYWMPTLGKFYGAEQQGLQNDKVQKIHAKKKRNVPLASMSSFSDYNIEDSQARDGSQPTYGVSVHSINKHFKYNFLPLTSKSSQAGRSSSVLAGLDLADIDKLDAETLDSIEHDLQHGMSLSDELLLQRGRTIQRTEERQAAAGLGYGRKHRSHYSYLSQSQTSRTLPPHPLAGTANVDTLLSPSATASFAQTNRSLAAPLSSRLSRDTINARSHHLHRQSLGYGWKKDPATFDYRSEVWRDDELDRMLGEEERRRHALSHTSGQSSASATQSGNAASSEEGVGARGSPAHWPTWEEHQRAATASANGTQRVTNNQSSHSQHAQSNSAGSRWSASMSYEEQF